MAVSVKIGGTTYAVANDYSIKEQGGAIATTSLKALLDANPVPVAFQQAIVYMDGVAFFAGIVQRIGTPEYSTKYESNVFNLEVSSIAVLLNYRRVTKNFYYYSYTSWSDVVQYIFDHYISEENITLGSISATSETFDSKYLVSDKSVSDVLNEIVDAIGHAAWWISADRKFYFKVNTEFTTVTPPAHARSFKVVDEIGDLRTVEKITGASAGITATAINESLRATIAARTGGSGKIEASDSDSDIHSDVKALAEANRRLANFAETQKTLTCKCHDLAASALYSLWPISRTINGVTFEGDYVVTERTIESFGPADFSISVTLRNRNYFARYGYSLQRVASIANNSAAQLSDIAADSKLTAGEKINELPRWQDELARKALIDSEAAAYSVPSTSYDAAFVSLSTYLNAGAAWASGIPAWFAGEAATETTTIDGAIYDSYWQAVSDARTALEIAVRAAIQSTADDAIAAAHEASITLSVSAQRITRSRIGTLTPSAVVVSSAYGDNGSAYAGQFSIDVSTNGTDFVNVYASAGDEATHSYAPTATLLGSFIALIRIRLYKAGLGSLIADSQITIDIDATSNPIYWGARTTAPTENIQPNDYYFDSNIASSGGGVIRYYTGSTWAQMTSAHSLYTQAVAAAISDMMVWASAQGATIAAANAVFESIAASSAFIQVLATMSQHSSAMCDDGVTPRAEFDWDNATLTLRNAAQTLNALFTNALAKFTAMSGAHKRGLLIGGDSLAWLDASDNILAEIKRLENSDKIVILDGDFRVQCSNIPGSDSIAVAEAAYSPCIRQKINGDWILIYARQSDQKAVVRTRTGGIGAWSSATQVSDDNSSCSRIIELVNGDLIAFYDRTSTGRGAFMKRYTGGAWGTALPITTRTLVALDLVELPDGSILFAYTEGGYLYGKMLSGVTLSSEITINSFATNDFSLLKKRNGDVLLSYYTSSGLSYKAYSDGSWGTAAIVTGTAAIGSSIRMPSIIEKSNGDLFAMHAHSSNSTIYFYTYSSGAWTAQGNFIGLTSYAIQQPSGIALADGALAIIYQWGYSSQIVLKVILDHAQLGAGIIAEYDDQTTGQHITKWSTGKMKIKGWTYQWESGMQNYTFKTMTYAIDFVGDAPQIKTNHCGVKAKASGVPTAISDTPGGNGLCYTNHDYSLGTPLHQFRLATCRGGSQTLSDVNYYVSSWEAEGLWK
jgi:hypothetical protein